MKNDYLSHLKTSESSDDVQELPGKKRGRPLLLGDQLDKQLRDYIVYLRSHGCIINAHVVIIMGKDSNLPYSNGGSLVPTKDWARNILNRMGMVRQRGSTKAKVLVENFDQVERLFLLDVKNTVLMNEIPPEMIMNCDHTAINYVPVSSWTMEQMGSKRVEIIEKEDKRQLMAVFGCSMPGDFLPPQLI